MFVPVVWLWGVSLEVFTAMAMKNPRRLHSSDSGLFTIFFSAHYNSGGKSDKNNRHFTWR